jgi:hypothetical protein
MMRWRVCERTGPGSRALPKLVERDGIALEPHGEGHLFAHFLKNPARWLASSLSRRKEQVRLSLMNFVRGDR